MAYRYKLFTQYNEPDEDEKKKKTPSQQASENNKRSYKVFTQYNTPAKTTATPTPTPTPKPTPTPVKKEEKKKTIFQKVSDTLTNLFRKPTAETPAINFSAAGTQKKPAKQTLSSQLQPDFAPQKVSGESAMATAEGKRVLGMPGQSFVAGMGDVEYTLGRTASWLGMDGVGTKLSKNGEYLQSFAPPDELGQFNWNHLYDPRFYATTITRALPFSLSLLPMAIIGAYGGAYVAGAAGLGAFGTAVLTAIGAAGLSRPMESALEAGGAYDEAIKKGKSKQQANDIANKTFKGNLALTGMDAAEFALAFAPVKGGNTLLKRIARTTGGLMGNVAMEGTEEVIQNNIVNVASGEPIDITSPEAQLAFATGGIMGAGLEVSGEIFTHVKDSVMEKSQVAQEEYTKLVNEGVPSDEAEIKALDKASEVKPEETQQIIEQAIEEVTVMPEIKQLTPDLAPAPEAAPSAQLAPEKKPTPEQSMAWITDQVFNNDVSTDQEFKEYVMTEGKLPEELADYSVKLRKFVQDNNIWSVEQLRQNEKAPKPPTASKQEAPTVSQPKLEPSKGSTEPSSQAQVGKIAVERPKPSNIEEVIKRELELDKVISEGEGVARQQAIDEWNTNRPARLDYEKENKETVVENENAKIETVKYGDNNYGYRIDYKVGNSGQSGPFTEGYASPEEAIADAIRTGERFIKNNQDAKPADVKRLQNTLDELKKKYGVKEKKPSVKDEFKVGDVLDTQGNTNMKGKVTIREIEGNTLKFTDEEGTDYSGMARAQVRTLVNEGQWKRAEETKPEAEKPQKPVEKEVTTENKELTTDFTSEALPEGENDVPVKADFAKETKRFLKDVLAELGWEPDRDAKGRDTSIYYNPSGPAVAGDVIGIFWKTPQQGIYINIGGELEIDPETGDHITVGTSGLGIMYRTITPDNKFTGGANHWISPKNLTPKRFAEVIRGLVDSAIIQTNEQPTVQPTGLPNAGEISGEIDRGRDTEIDERTRNDETSGDGESGTGLERDRGASRGIGKVGRFNANATAISILEEHAYSPNASDYTQDEIESLRQYTGSGGKEAAGATGKGLLSEYYTPKAVTDRIWAIVKKLAPDAKAALEPAVGIGSLLEGRPEGLAIKAYEYQKVSGTIAKILNPDIDVSIGTGIEFGNPGNFETDPHTPRFDVVIGNPPFGDRASFLKGKGEERNINRWEEYFIKRGLDSLLKNGNNLVYVVNSSFLKTGVSTGKREIGKSGRMMKAYRLPEGIFADTSIGTDIVIFEKAPQIDEHSSEGRLELTKRLEDISNDTYFTKNPDDILGTVEERVNRFGRPETYVKGTIADVERANAVIEATETQEVETPKEKTKPKKPAEISYAAKTKHSIDKQKAEGKLPAIIKPDKKKVETVPIQRVDGGELVRGTISESISRNTAVDGSIPESAAPKKEINYWNGKFYHDINYFSGDIYQKLADLEIEKKDIIDKMGKEQYEKQLDGLEKVKPVPVSLKEITFDPLDRFITQVTTNEEGLKVIDEFNNWLNNTTSALSYGVSKYDIRNYVNGYRASPGTKNIMGFIKADTSRLFNYFIRNVLNPEIQATIVNKFNREKNSYVNPDYAKLPAEVRDMAKYFRGKSFTLSKTQSNGVSFLTNKGVGLVAYGVGVGKTHTLLTATMVSKQKGWTKRPLFTVPKSTLSQTWISTIRSMFPNETIVNLGGLTKPDIDRLERERGKDKKKWIKDGEVSVLTHEGMLRLGFTTQELTDAVSDLNDALWTETDTERQAQVQQGKIEEIVGRAQYKAGDIMISDLGFDHISVDEVHNFRKIFQGAKPEALNPDGTVDKSKTRRFGNIVGGTPAKIAQQLFLISQHILKRNNYRGVFLASATPFENHATEVYNILSLIARDRMQKMGIFNINDFFALFSNFETEMDKNVRGEWVNKEKMKSFKNLPQLQKLLREFVDYQVDPTLVRPERRVITPHLQMSEKQEENLAHIQEMLKPAEGRQPEEGAVLKASTYSVANSISPYFIREYHPEIVTPEELIDDSPKLKYSMELIKKLREGEKTKKYGTFLYMGANGVDYHYHIQDYAIKHLGFKPKEVAVINGATSNDEREAIKMLFNRGDVKLLIGGDPTKEGIDLQNNGYVTINVALGWNPTEPAQVEGRVWRQGNKRSIAPLIYPLVENSGDITVYNKFEEKGSRINDLFSYQGQVFDVGELDPREKKLALMTNPEDKAAVEIEMDKATLQQKLLMFSTDIADYNRMKSRMADLQNQIEYNENRVKSGQSSYGYKLEPEQITQYRKEITKQKRELKYITDRLAAQKITNLEQKIAEVEKLKEETNIEIGKITETFSQRLIKFQKEYDEMIANRKAISDHVNEFFDKTKDLYEKSEEEIQEQKMKLMAELERKTIAEQSYKTPSGNADVGGYAELEPSGVVIDRIRPIQFPELVNMVKELTGDVPKLKKFKDTLGKMYESGKGIIKLNPTIFNDIVKATKVLSHEIGHLADFIPDGFTTRGNVIGHIASLNKYMMGKYSDLENKIVRKELKTLTQIWKPFDETVNENFTKYRYSAKELYADAVSVLLNDPGLLQKIAPKFYDGFFEYLHNKPEYEQVYFDTLELLNQGDEAVNNKRLEQIYQGFEEAARKRAEIEARVVPRKSWWQRFMRNHVTKFDPIYRKLGRVNVGVVESPLQKVREALEEMQLRRNDQAIFLDRITTEITDALEKLGMDERDLGVVLELEREAFGDRIDVANPGGLIGKIPETQLADFYKRKGWTEEQMKLFEKIKDRFHELIFAESERAVNNGNYSRKIFEEKIEPNKNTYATFQVVHHIHDNYIPAGIKSTLGTLSEIENPFTSTVLKTLALIDWNNMQEAKQIAVGELAQYFPDDVTEAKAIKSSEGQVIKFKKEEGKETLEMMKDGQRVAYNVDPYIKSMFENTNMTPDETHLLVEASRLFNRFFKPLVTTYNLSWGFYSNIIRDSKRTYISLGAALNKYAKGKKSLSIAELLTTYLKSIPEGAKFAAGKRDALIKEMLANKALTTSWSQYDPYANNESDIAFLLRKHRIIGDKPGETKGLRKVWNQTFQRILDAIQFAGGTFEATSKISGYQIAKKRIQDGKKLGFLVRNYVGTPNYSEGGAWKQVDNSVFVFSNMMAQATRVSAELAVDPKTASGYWMRTFMVGVLPKLIMLAGIAGLFGEWVRKNYEMQTEYDKTNFTTVPVGFDENGKAIYARIPGDETERFISALVWKIGSAFINKKMNQISQIFSMGAGYLPSVTPLWTFLGDWMQYFNGKNPYDSYRGRLAIDEQSWKAGGTIRLNKMVQYSLNTIGLGNFKTYDTSGNSTLETTVSKIPVINRMFKISNYGIYEQYTSRMDQEQAIKAIRKRDIVDKYVKLSRGIEDEAELSGLRTEMVREYFGELPKDPDLITEAKALAKKFNIQRVRGESPYMDKLINSNLNAEKLDYLLQFQKVMRKDDFKSMVNDALKYKIISQEVIDRLKEHDAQTPEEKKNLLNFLSPKKAYAMREEPRPVVAGKPMIGPLQGFGTGLNPNIQKLRDPNKEKTIAIIDKAAKEFGVNPDLAIDIAFSESSLNPNAKSKWSTAEGLFQFLNASWAQMMKELKLPANTPKTDPEANARAAMMAISKGRLRWWDESKPMWGKYHKK